MLTLFKESILDSYGRIIVVNPLFSALFNWRTIGFDTGTYVW